MPKKTFIVLFIIFALTYIMQRILPLSSQIHKNLFSAPRQTETTAQSFIVQKGDLEFQIDPLYNYELYGLIVSEHNTQNFLDYYHSQWQDTLNIKDICVIWGDNLKDGNFRKLKYRNGSWTCYVSAKSQSVWRQFDMAQLSNNHLLIDNSDLLKTLIKAKRGDQIYLKGLLANYSHKDDINKRKTSVSRDDRVCEIVFINEFEIIKRNKPFWQFLHTATKLVIILMIIFTIYRFLSTPAFQKNPSDY